MLTETTCCQETADFAFGAATWTKHARHLRLWLILRLRENMTSSTARKYKVSEKEQAMATGNTYRGEFGESWTCSF